MVEVTYGKEDVKLKAESKTSPSQRISFFSQMNE